MISVLGKALIKAHFQLCLIKARSFYHLSILQYSLCAFAAHHKQLLLIYCAEHWQRAALHEIQRDDLPFSIYPLAKGSVLNWSE